MALNQTLMMLKECGVNICSRGVRLSRYRKLIEIRMIGLLI